MPKKVYTQKTKRQSGKAAKKINQNPKAYLNWLILSILGFLGGFSCQFFPGLNDFVKEEAVSRPVHLAALHHSERLPQAMQIIEREGYTIAYDGRCKTALWVYEELTKKSCTGEGNRMECQFMPDPDIPAVIRADLLDYKGSGFDRGHLASAADHKLSMSALQQTFYLSNICPQVPQLNRGCWIKLENHIRDLTEQYSIVRAITGPLYLPHLEPSGKKYVTYEVIGKNNIAVPTHFFKVVIAGEGRLSRQWAYIVPNEFIDSSVSLDTFLTTIETIERTSGIIFN